MFIPFIAGNTGAEKDAQPPLVFYNTLTREKERFTPLKPDFVRLYSCGPTVYDHVHIGNLRSYLLSDMVRRVLRLNRYKVKQVMNTTDIGHLVDGADTGDDKMAGAVKREGLPMTLESMKQVADTYIDSFLHDLDEMHIKRPHALPRPSSCIPEQVALIETLAQKEYAYRTSDGVYFDTGRFSSYGKLGNIDIKGLQEGARVDENSEKRNATDFALWKREDSIGWESPWGRGFPGWHIECSAMAMSHLGKQIDIHTGGEDLARVHHNNEIAQSEAATGKPFVRYWLHNAFLMIDDTKISKSLGNTLQLHHLTDAGHSALAYRYWLLTAHYRSPINFSWNALEAAAKALQRLQRFYFEKLDGVKPGTVPSGLLIRIKQTINDDLDTPKTIALLWEVVKDESLSLPEKKAALAHFDLILGLGLSKNDTAQPLPVSAAPIPLAELPEKAQTLVTEREAAREQKDWAKSDELRDALARIGYSVTDSAKGPKVYRVPIKIKIT